MNAHQKDEGEEVVELEFDPPISTGNDALEAMRAAVRALGREGFDAHGWGFGPSTARFHIRLQPGEPEAAQRERIRRTVVQFITKAVAPFRTGNTTVNNYFNISSNHDPSRIARDVVAETAAAGSRNPLKGGD